MALHIHILPVLKDNYVYLLHDDASGNTAAVDPSLAKPVLAALKKKGWQLTHILCTHHHWDHTGGNLELKAETGCVVVGYADDAHRIPGIDVRLEEGESYNFGSHAAQMLFIPGHTLGHIAYYFAEEKLLFCGDTLFSMGCGRLFEGTPEQMYHSLSKLAALPDDTKVYCGHEYSEANGHFALTLEPHNRDLQARMEEVKRQRGQSLPTLPSTIGMEKRTNPFLRTQSAAIQKNLGLKGEDSVKIFAELRRRKDDF